MFLHSRFAPADIDKEREVIKEEMAMYCDQPQQHVQELLNATLWPDQPLGRPITGTANPGRPEPRPSCWSSPRAITWPANTSSSPPAGCTTPQLVQARQRASPAASRRPTPRIRPGPTASNAARASGCSPASTEQTQLALGIRTCSRHDARRYALRLLNTILGENMSSRLFQVMREDRGLAYSVYSTPSFFADTGDLVISAGLDTGQSAARRCG